MRSIGLCSLILSVAVLFGGCATVAGTVTNPVTLSRALYANSEEIQKPSLASPSSNDSQDRGMSYAQIAVATPNIVTAVILFEIISPFVGFYDGIRLDWQMLTDPKITNQEYVRKIYTDVVYPKERSKNW